MKAWKIFFSRSVVSKAPGILHKLCEKCIAVNDCILPLSFSRMSKQFWFWLKKGLDVKLGRSRGSSVHIVINLRAGKCMFLVPVLSRTKTCFSTSQCPMTMLDFTHPPSQSLPEVLSTGAKWMSCEADYLLESRLLKS